jgi:hypothetical protein
VSGRSRPLSNAEVLGKSLIAHLTQRRVSRFRSSRIVGKQYSWTIVKGYLSGPIIQDIRVTSDGRGEYRVKQSNHQLIFTRRVSSGTSIHV